MDYVPDRNVVETNIPIDSEVNLKLQNIMMLLRKCCNHPYLIEYPIDPVTQEFKVNILISINFLCWESFFLLFNILFDVWQFYSI